MLLIWLTKQFTQTLKLILLLGALSKLSIKALLTSAFNCLNSSCGLGITINLLLHIDYADEQLLILKQDYNTSPISDEKNQDY